MGSFNTGDFNTSDFNGEAPPFVFVPPTVQITLSAPLAPPPIQLTNASTLINGQYREAGIFLYRNGVLLTKGPDYTRNGGLVTLVVPPGEGDILTARVFAIGLALGGPTPTRYIAPWTFRLTGAFDGKATLYQIVFGPTIMGGCDGKNNLFTWNVLTQRAQVFRNGLLQTVNVDIATGQFAVVFLPGAIPQPGDLITVLSY